MSCFVVLIELGTCKRGVSSQFFCQKQIPEFCSYSCTRLFEYDSHIVLKYLILG